MKDNTTKRKQFLPDLWTNIIIDTFCGFLFKKQQKLTMMLINMWKLSKKVDYKNSFNKENIVYWIDKTQMIPVVKLSQSYVELVGVEEEE